MDTSKSYFWKLLNILLMVVIANVVFFVMPAVKRYGESFAPARTVTVSAEGKATVTPDLAEVSLSVISKGKNPEELVSANNEKITAIIQNVKSHGIEAKDIKTTAYNLSPDYRYDPQTERNFITGYTMTQTVHVKVRDLSKVANVIAGATPLGANQIGGVSFSVENQERFLAEARGDAFAKAREKAASMAKENRVKLGKLVQIAEFQGGGPIPYYLSARSAEKDGSVTPPTIEPGTQEVRMQVSLTYALK